MKGVYGLELEGPSFNTQFESTHRSRRNRKRNYIRKEALQGGREAFKSLENVPTPSSFTLQTNETKEDPLSKLEIELQSLLSDCKGKLDKNRKYTVNKKMLKEEIENLVHNEFKNMFRVIAYSQ